MSERKRLETRLPLLIAASAALTLSLARCSPVSPSLSKFRQESSGASGAAPSRGGGDVGPMSLGGPSSASVSQPSASKLQGVPVQLEEFAAYDDSIKALSPMRTVTLSPELNRREFRSFKQKRAILLHVEGEQPESCQAYIGLAQSSSALQAMNPGTVATDCTWVADGVWKLSISAGTTASTWQWVQQSAQGVTLTLGHDAHASLKGVSAVDASVTTPTEASCSVQ